MVDALLLRVGEFLATSLVNTLGCHFARDVLSRDKKRKIFFWEKEELESASVWLLQASPIRPNRV